MRRRGTLFTYTVVHSGTEVFKDRTPYVVALVEEDRQLGLARVEGYVEGKAIGIGMEVEFLTEEPDGQTIYRFL